MSMIVAGGLYLERCLSPDSRELFGSGGRAAAALSQLTSVTLHTFFPDLHEADALANMASFGVEALTHSSTDVVEFHYHFPLSTPRFAPVPIPTADAVHVSGQDVIRFGCVEGEMIVDAETAVFDPQSGGRPNPFHLNGSKAARLAIVMNRGELERLSKGASMDEQVANLEDAPAVAVIKCGAHGASVYENGVLMDRVPVFKSSSVYKIGSGDIFTAMFAHHWCERGLRPVDAAREASKYVSYYVETRAKQMPAEISDREAWQPDSAPKKVYLAGSFFSTEHVWLVEETYRALCSLGLAVFSPYHDVGVGIGTTIAEADLKGLEDCGIVLALLSDLDPGTLFEVGHAIANGKKVIGYAVNTGPQDLTMIQGTGCEVFTDLSTAIYRTAWASME